ncbi:MAG: hypothetical protein DRN96_08030 [Thermoproteota archaeon]|nr:MAG: hypothetical protein DRN96_08030 [Candidatus Korarchaeota archaeon]
MPVFLVASRRDPAGLRIAEWLATHYGTRTGEDTYTLRLSSECVLKLVSCDIVHTPSTAVPGDAELAVFLSRHSGRSPPVLSTHVTGNFGEASLGGESGKLSIAPASKMKLFLMEASRQAESIGYEAAFECTHHGPTLDCPVMFAEVGSKLENWLDRRAASAVGEAVAYALEERRSFPAAVAFGGPHINRRYTRAMVEGELAIGHAMSKHYTHLISESLVEYCVARTLEPVSTALVDWKGMRGAERRRLLEALSKLGIPYIKASELGAGLEAR